MGPVCLVGVVLEVWATKAQGVGSECLGDDVDKLRKNSSGLKHALPPALINCCIGGGTSHCLGTGQQPTDASCSTQAGVQWWGS